MGLAIARALVERGAKIALTARDGMRLAAAAALWMVLAKRRELLGRVGSVRGVARALLVVLFAISALSIVVLLPYWGLVGNLRGI